MTKNQKGEKMNKKQLLENIAIYLKSRVSDVRLRSGQKGIFQALYYFLQTQDEGYFKLPSGIGKTNLAIELGEAGKFKKILFMVPTLVLMEQTKRRFKKFTDVKEIDFFFGAKKGTDAKVVIGTYSSLQNQNDKKKFKNFDLIIWDEVHETLTPKRRAIKKLFKKDAIHLGLTASDAYNELKKVDLVMPCIYEMSIEEAIKLNMLAGVRCWIAQTNIDISSITICRGEYDPKKQSRVIDVARRNQAAVDIYQKFLNGQTCIVSAINIAHAIKIAKMFNQSGIPAEAIYANSGQYKMSKKKREAILEKFRAGELKVVTSVNILDRGFDNTLVSALINLRITGSLVKATQRGGRVLRLFNGNDDRWPIVKQMINRFGGKLATIIDFLDECQNHQFRPVLFSDILNGVQVLPEAMEEKIKQIDPENSDLDIKVKPRNDYLWPTDAEGVKIKLITDLTEVARITQSVTSFAHLPVANEDGIVFLPVKD